MIFYVEKITNLELLRGSCRCLIFVRPLFIEADICPCKGKGTSDCFKIKETFFISEAPDFM